MDPRGARGVFGPSGRCGDQQACGRRLDCGLVIDPRRPAWARASLLGWAETMIRTDADGRFRLEFLPDQVAERRLTLALRSR